MESAFSVTTEQKENNDLDLTSMFMDMMGI